MAHGNLVNGSVWLLRHGEREVARLTVTEADFPWVHADVELLPDFEPFRAVFAEQERALDADDWDQADACYTLIRRDLTLEFPDGSAVPEFMLHIHGDGTAGWRWHHEPFAEEPDG